MLVGIGALVAAPSLALVPGVALVGGRFDVVSQRRYDGAGVGVLGAVTSLASVGAVLSGIMQTGVVGVCLVGRGFASSA